MHVKTSCVVLYFVNFNAIAFHPPLLYFLIDFLNLMKKNHQPLGQRNQFICT